MQGHGLSRAAQACARGVLVWGLAFCLRGAPACAAEGEALEAVLGSPASDWKIYGEPKYTLDVVDGRPLLKVGPGGLALGRLPKVTADSEVRVRFRLTTTAARGASLVVTPGLQDPDVTAANALSIRVSAPAGDSPNAINVNGDHYMLRDIPGSRFSFPDRVRARMEQDYASLESVNERWLTARHVIRDRGTQAAFDGLFLKETTADAAVGEGHLRIDLSEGVELASISVKPLPPADARFEVIDIGPYANASLIAGGRLADSAVPVRGEETRVGEVPFVFAVPDARGRDHIDLGVSWANFGLAKGYICPAQSDPARWRGAACREAGRIQLRVPNGRYTRLHLIAAFEDEPDTTPVVTAQFYRPWAGHPVNFQGRVPAFTARASRAAALPVTLSNGRRGHLHRVTIPLEPGGLAAFADLPYLEVELTKETTIYRAFPDPMFYSLHAAGLPSGVHVFAATFERSPVDVAFEPDNYAHIWTAPETPSYTVTLANRTRAEQSVTLTLTTESHDGLEKTRGTHAVRVPADGEARVALPLNLKRYGYHTVTLRIADGQGESTRSTSLAYLHPDTRERGDWAEGKGPIFGFWDWNGGHGTPKGIPRLEVMYRAGVESSMSPLSGAAEEEKEYLEAHQFVTHFLAYQFSPAAMMGEKWDPSKPEEMGTALVAKIKDSALAQPSTLNKPELVVFFAEPQLGPVSSVSQPEHFGEPEHQMTDAEQALYKSYLDQFLIAATALKKEWPQSKMIFPWGIPSFPIPYLKYSPEATALMDGPGVDVVLFERPPEMQIHQVTFASVLWQLKQAWLKTGKAWPNLISIEGPVPSPTMPGAVTRQEEADHFVRANLILNSAYSVTRLLGFPSVAHCSGFWGEQHYGGGLLERIPLLNPKIGYVAFATSTRHLNRMNFVKALPTESLTVFCLQYKHYGTGELLHVLWTLRGTRPVTFEVPRDACVTVYDQNDNPAEYATRNGTVTFAIGTSPSYVRGLEADVKMSLGQPNHDDSKPAEERARLGNIGDGAWRLSAECDEDYENSHFDFVRRFPGKMSVTPVAAPAEQGKRALAVRLEKQEKERKVMPFYTTLVPATPIEIPGKPSALGLWVHAAGDWGRVVYCLKDAKGERWISVGQAGEWNVDDTHCWSAFCFDGWRYLRFELPGNAPYDGFREAGTSFWGSYGEGDEIVDLPLALDKIIVERRTHVIKLDELLPADPSDVLLGDIFAEYAKGEDAGAEAVRRSRLRMAMPETIPELPNPIADLAKSGVGTAPAIAKIAPPEREYDGTRCHVHFDPVAGAKHYDIWVSPYPDGRGALQLGKGWTKPGQLLTGLNANTDLYLFVVAATVDGQTTMPSSPFKINLKNMFPFR